MKTNKKRKNLNLEKINTNKENEKNKVKIKSKKNSKQNKTKQNNLQSEKNKNKGSKKKEDKKIIEVTDRDIIELIDSEEIKNNNIEKAKEKKKNTNHIKPYMILLAIAICIIAVYVCYMVVRLVKNPTDIYSVSIGTLLEEENVEGILVREETVVEGENTNNGIIKIKAEGERTAKGDAIFRYYSSSEEELETKINELDLQIQEILTTEDGNIVTDKKLTDKKLLESQIENELLKVYNQNDIQSIEDYKKNINTYVTKKAKIAGELSPAGSNLKKLIDERNEYETRLNENTQYVNAGESGIVSYRIDGLESSLNTKDFSKIDKKMLENLNLKTGQLVSSSDTSAKIINNYSAYIVFNSNSEETNNVEVGDKIKISIQNSNPVVATIENIINEKDESKTITLKVVNYIDRLTSYRKISIDVIWWSAEGFKIPNTAIRTIDGIDYVIRNRNGYLDKMAINVLKKGKDYSIVKANSRSTLLELGLTSDEIAKLKTLTVYDEIIVNPTEKQLLQ